MSLLSPGQRCTLCSIVDFLPLTCPSCDQVYCKDHIQSSLHTCTQTSLDGTTSTDKPGRLDRGKTICEVRGCERESIESIAGFVGRDVGEGIAKEVRCGGCGGAFCVEHRSQSTHSCSAPLDHNIRYDAFLERRTKAREIIAKQFPEYGDRVIPKPPPGKDVIKPQKVSEKLPPSVQQQQESGSTSANAQTQTQVDGTKPTTMTAKPKVKSKADKLWDIHLKKIRMSAEPLLKGARSDSLTEKVYFEWAIDLSETHEGVRGWREKGKWAGQGKVERAWVGGDMPVGKMLDLMIERGKVKRSANDDESQSLHLLSLHSPPDEERQITQLELSKPAKIIPQGSSVILIRGKWE
ncbi:hypothetical protein I302_100217 [Kwoniella bestiolae CBS 10118]|uniref:AN1-type domain-containing protein n=1 Tax=Kwoniella bestiolae CBS 10118 TaxID=1296100 RepID=A0A1B9G4F3_9TREE|nr:hypothetical protein I302_03590 [Kwoniella bestiolae CBS 10118]OCF25914.1 hypothetical protein I302_03590 [Kwoniella bestiolae CBS 10118]